MPVLPGTPPLDITLRRSARARRFSLRVSALDGRVTLSIPQRAREAEAMEFARQHEDWLRAALARQGGVATIGFGTTLPIEGRDVVLAGDAAGVVAPASGEGIYYAMYGGELAAHAVETLLKTGEVKSLRLARKQFMKAHRTVFTVLGIMQWFWYCNEKRRERFVKICEDRDVQQLTFESYMNKKLVRKKPMAHVRIFLKDMGHLLGLAKV